MCCFLKREILDDIDIGFAMLPDYTKQGYGFEIASATMGYAKMVLKIDEIVAITDADNKASIKLLNKIGLSFDKRLKLSYGESVLLFKE